MNPCSAARWLWPSPLFSPSPGFLTLELRMIKCTSLGSRGTIQRDMLNTVLYEKRSINPNPLLSASTKYLRPHFFHFVMHNKVKWKITAKLSTYPPPFLKVYQPTLEEIKKKKTKQNRVTNQATWKYSQALCVFRSY